MKEFKSDEKDSGESNSKNHTYVKVDNVDPSKFCIDLYGGQGGFLDNSYLIPHNREFFYDRRKEKTALRKYYSPILDATYLPVFGEAITRTYTQGEDIYKPFVEDCTNGNVPLDTFLKDATKQAKNNGVIAIVMDNFDELSDVRSENITNRDLPYVYIRNSLQIDYSRTTVDKFGNLTKITFLEGEDATDSKMVYKQWDNEQWRTFKGDNEKEEKTISSDYHGLGVIPVYLYRFGEILQGCDVKTLPQYYDLAKQNFRLYLADSELDQHVSDQMFSILYAQGIDATSQTIGTNVLMAIPLEDNVRITPGFISADASLFKEEREYIASIIDSLYQLASQSGVTGVTDSASGIAKQWDFFATEIVLKHTSESVQNCNDWIEKLYSIYVGEEIEVEAVFPLDFQPQNLLELADIAERYSLLDAPKASKQIVFKQVFDKITFGDDSPATDQVRTDWENDTAGMSISDRDNVDPDVDVVIE